MEGKTFRTVIGNACDLSIILECTKCKHQDFYDRSKMDEPIRLCEVCNQHSQHPYFASGDHESVNVKMFKEALQKFVDVAETIREDQSLPFWVRVGLPDKGERRRS